MSLKKITKAVIPAAGFGTRVLPASKAIPKELIPIVDKPAIQYIVEEAVKSGITDILIITSSGKSSIQEHFDSNFELEYKLKESNKKDIYENIIEISNLANIFFIMQKEMKGLGNAITYAESFTKDEPFCVLYGDDVIDSEYPVAKQLIDAYEEFCSICVGIKKVSEKDISKYSSLSVKHLKENFYKVDDMFEKPQKKEDILSLYSILGRCLLTSEIFEILKDTKEGAGGEIQLTDAMSVISRKSGIIGVDFIGQRYDIGSKLGILEANIQMGLKHPEIGENLKNYIKSLTI